MLTTAEIAAQLRVTPRTVINYIKSGKLRAKRVGRPWVVEEESLKAALQMAQGQFEEAGRED